MFFLPKDVSEEHDLIAGQPKRATELFEQWTKWNESNVPCRIMGYTDYHKQRDKFFTEAVPEPALKAGYTPTFKGNFK